MKKVHVFLLVVFSAAFLFHQEPLYPASKSAEFRYFFRDTPEQILADLSIEEKIGQIMIFGFYGRELDKDHEAWMAEGRLGNIKIFLRNVRSLAQLRALTDLHAAEIERFGVDGDDRSQLPLEPRIGAGSGRLRRGTAR